MITEIKFSIDDAQHAIDEWGANCGPAALAAAMGMTLDQVRPHLGDFERKHYTNPRLMYAALKSLGVKWSAPSNVWPQRGLVRVQWEGPWTAPGVPMGQRQRHTHWVASFQPDGGMVYVFDVNCMSVGGIVKVGEWATQVVPWILEQCEPDANGEWNMTHALELIDHFSGMRGGMNIKIFADYADLKTIV